MKPSRVASLLLVLAVSASVAWAQRHGAANNSFPSASVTSMRNFPAASATSMGSLPPWTFNNSFGFGNFDSSFGGLNTGAAGFNSGFGNFRTGFTGFNNASVGRGRFHRHRRGFGFDNFNGGYGYGYYYYPWIYSDNVYGGSFYDDVNARMNNGRFYPEDQAPTDQYATEQPQQQPYVVQQQPAPSQPIVFIVDRDGNMRQYDYMQGKHSGTGSGPQTENRAPAPAPQPAVEDVKTVLVYRDGHRREIANYAIMGNKLYLSPHGTVALSELDIPATVAANDERGIAFRVPTANR